MRYWQCDPDSTLFFWRVEQWLQLNCHAALLCRSNVSLVVLVMEGTRGIDFMFGIILSVVVANWVAHHIHHDGVYESELERIGNLYFLRDEPPHRLVCWILHVL